MVWKFSEFSFLKNLKNIYFIWLCWVFLMACRIFSSSIWDLVSWSGIKTRPHALGAWSLRYSTIREVPMNFLSTQFFFFFFRKSKMVLKNKVYWSRCFLLIKIKSRIPSECTFPQFNCWHLSHFSGFCSLQYLTPLNVPSFLHCFFFSWQLPLTWPSLLYSDWFIFKFVLKK